MSVKRDTQTTILLYSMVMAMEGLNTAYGNDDYTPASKHCGVAVNDILKNYQGAARPKFLRRVKRAREALPNLLHLQTLTGQLTVFTRAFILHTANTPPATRLAYITDTLKPLLPTLDALIETKERRMLDECETLLFEVVNAA